MKKTVVIFGLLHTLVDIDGRFHSDAPMVMMKPKSGIVKFMNSMRKIKETEPAVDFAIASNLGKDFEHAFVKMTSTDDLFMDGISLSSKREEYFDDIYFNIFHTLFNYRSKRVFEIQGYDRIILIDSVREQKIDFHLLKSKLKKNSELAPYKDKLFAYIYATNFDDIEYKLADVLKEEKGVIIK